jgi:hypothetical protein
MSSHRNAEARGVDGIKMVITTFKAVGPKKQDRHWTNWGRSSPWGQPLMKARTARGIGVTPVCRWWQVERATRMRHVYLPESRLLEHAAENLRRRHTPHRPPPLLLASATRSVSGRWWRMEDEGARRRHSNSETVQRKHRTRRSLGWVNLLTSRLQGP